MNTVYTPTQDSTLDQAQSALRDGRAAEDATGYIDKIAGSHYNHAAAAALVAIAEHLPALVTSQQAIAKVLTDVYSAESGALAVIDAAADVQTVEPYAGDDAGKGATSAQTTTDAQAKLNRLIAAVKKYFGDDGYDGVPSSALLAVVAEVSK